MDDLSKQEELVDQYVGENNKEAAAKLLFDLIVNYARKKDFAKAEALRERIYEVDPMALNEILKSGDIIEEEKSQSIDQDNKDIWAELYDTMSSEEAYALYDAMKEATYDPGQPIFEQGDRNSNLYFINQGKLQMVYSQEGNEMLINKLGAGDIAGEDTFFSNAAFCTISLITLSQVKLNFLEQAILLKWKDEFPSLESRLHDYCIKAGMVHELLQKKDLDRRTQKRVNISGNAVIQILNTSGNPSGKAFKGALLDISVGGFSFLLKISKQETARLLLGRKLNIRFTFPTGETQQEIDQNGTVVGVRDHVFGDHSVHVKFDKMLSERLIELIEEAESPAVGVNKIEGP